MDHCQNASKPEPSLETVTASPEAEESAERAPAAVRDLDAWADELRQRNLAKALDGLDDLSPDDRAAIAACSRGLVDALLRSPRWQLRNADEPDAIVADLFDLEE